MTLLNHVHCHNGVLVLLQSLEAPCPMHGYLAMQACLPGAKGRQQSLLQEVAPLCTTLQQADQGLA